MTDGTRRGTGRGAELPPLIVAPTERHAAINGLAASTDGTVSMLPEKHGCDVLWRAQDGWWGVQRKELADFIASVQDGRLAREVAMMKEVAMKIVLIEGRIQYTNDDMLMFNKRGQAVTRSQFYGMQFSLMAMNVHVMFVRDQAETAEWISTLARWSMKSRHTSMMRRPGPVSMWGTVGDEDWSLHFLQGLDGLGIEKARAIVTHFGGVPMDWSCSEKDLMQVPGIGKTLAKRMMNALRRVEPTGTEE